MTEHQLLLFLLEVAVLVVAARLGAELAERLGIAQVVGELVVGICLGPSLFGALWHGGFLALFPAEPLQRGLLEIMGWMGVIFLVIISGLETRLDIMRTAGRAVVSGWIGGFVLPFAMGFGLGWLIPANLIGLNVTRPVFALFVGTALAISAIPVIARILLDLGLFQTRIGVIIISTATADDTIGWIVLAAITGLASAGHAVNVPVLATALVGTAAWVVFAFTLGQRLVDWCLASSLRLRGRSAQTSVIVVLTFLGGAATQAIHVHLVLGAFVMGILISRSPHLLKEATGSIRRIGFAFFIPFFFAYTGIKVDLTTITGAAIPVAVGAVAVACVGKLVGAGLGARIGGLSKWESLAVGAGRNARGAMELVIAAIGLSIGALTLPMYSIIVLVAAVTTLMAAPMLRYCVRRQREIDGTTDADLVGAVPA